MNATARRFLVWTLPIVLATAAAAEAPPPTLESVSVAPGVFMLSGPGGNVGVVVAEDGVFLVDDQYPQLAPAVVAAVAAITPKPIRFVVNTHWHGDHTGGNELLGGSGSLVFAHENVRRRMSSEQVNELLGRTTPPSPAGALPIVTFSDAVTFHLGGHEVRAFHVPAAHTDGDAIVHLVSADVVHLGDVLFNRLYPFVDLWSGGSVEGTIAAVERVLATAGPGTKFIPGHGRVADRADLLAYVEVLRGGRAAVAKLVEAGKSRDEAVAARPTAAWDSTWAWSFISAERWVAILWEDVSRRRAASVDADGR